MRKENAQSELICDLTGFESDNQQKQRRRMVLALVLLLVALVFVIMRSRGVWIQVFSIAASEVPQGSPSTIEPSQQKTRLSSRQVKRPEPPRRTVPAYTSEIDRPEITGRAVWPHVDILRSAGQHQVIYGRDSSIRLNLKRSSTRYDAAERVSFSSEALEVESLPVEPKYPLLAKSMNVQGSVVLLARIDQTGKIEDLQVLSGPEILASAAQEAVKQWHFKPSFPSGQAVKTETRITVKFSILTQ